ncbi:MAG TPA: carbohydrate ABC transporter substrate-binding protein, partial [Kribbella sp.]
TTDDAPDLVRRLAAPNAADPWIREGGFLVDGRVAGYSSELTRLAEQLAKPGEQLQFDLSDRLGRLGDINGLWRVLTDFLIKVGGRGAAVVPEAVDAAVRELRKVEG